MPKILFIASHRFNRSPSQRYRFEQYFGFLEANGFKCELSSVISEADDRVFYQKGKWIQKGFILLKSIFVRIGNWKNYSNYDIIFVQREALMIGSVFFEKKIKKSNAKFVFDFDDSIWLMDTSEGNKKLEWLKNPEKTSKNIAYADLVFAGNAYLANYAGQYNSNVKIIPTTIDTNFHKPLSIKKKTDSVTIGWSGSITTIKHFENAIPILQTLKNKYREKINFVVMGDASYTNETLGIQGIAWSADNEVQTINSFDIGIMPLPDDEWAKGKCGLKGLSYMACGVPTIMSPVGVNSEIIEHEKNGFLVSTPEEWIDCISRLIENPDLRKEVGTNARKTVEEKYSVNALKGIYLLELQKLVNR